MYSQNEIIELHKLLADIYSMSGDFSHFNAQHLEIAKLLENDGYLNFALKQLDYCVEYKLYDKILEKKGNLLLKLFKYESAANVLKECGKIYFEKSTHTGSIYARPFFFMPILSVMATKQLANLNDHMLTISHIDHKFVDSCEGKFITSLIIALNNGYINEFEQACATYELSKKLLPLQVQLLLLGKEMLSGVDKSLNDGFNDVNTYCDIDLLSN